MGSEDEVSVRDLCTGVDKVVVHNPKAVGIGTTRCYLEGVDPNPGSASLEGQ